LNKAANESCRDVMASLLDLEERLELFDRRAADAYFWEYARLPI
jgi:hypothetical protein